MTDREARRDAERTEHILDAAAKLAEIVAEGREAFDTSWRQRDIAERRLEIIGEAAGIDNRTQQVCRWLDRLPGGLHSQP